MTQENKQLLLADLCGRLPYEVKVQYNNEIYNIDYISALYEEVKMDIPDNYTIGISEIKPYLRPMSSMTEEEKRYINNRWGADNYGDITTYSSYESGVSTVELADIIGFQDWLNAHHFDYRRLIEKGFAIKVTKENNPYENNNQKTI